MSDFQTKPNTGSMFLSKQKKHDKAPDFYGSISIEPALLIELAKSRNSELVEIKLDAWKGTTKNGDPWLSLKVNTWKPQERQDAPTEKDPWE